MIEPLELEFRVACPVDRAFEVWTARTSLWWPVSHSVSAEPGLTITFEPVPGGRIFERTPLGVEHDWGEVSPGSPHTGSCTSGISASIATRPPRSS